MGLDSLFDGFVTRWATFWYQFCDFLLHLGSRETVLPPARELCFEYFEASETDNFSMSRFTAMSGGIFMVSGCFRDSNMASVGTILLTLGH